MDVYHFMGILMMMTHQFLPSVEHNVNGNYYKVNLGLAVIPTDIPRDVVSVHLFNNQITKIQTNVFSQLSQCRTLYLSDNEISEVEPGAFNGLRSLNELALRSNKLERLFVNMFSDMVSCTDLKVDINLISEIEPGAFNGLSNLEHLYLRRNQIIQLGPGVFSGLKNVKELYLNRNQMTLLKAEMFQGLEEVKTIYLHYNKISSIEKNTFINLTKLEILWLSDNDLEVLTEGMFARLEFLREINLIENHLKTLSADVFSHLPRPLNILVHENPLQCDTALCWLKQEELNGTITWFSFNSDPPDSLYKPQCANEKDWEAWICNVSDKLKWYLISVGVAVVLTVVTRAIVFIYLKREKLFVKYQQGNNTSQVEFSNTCFSVEMEDEPEYTGLKGNTDGYTALQKDSEIYEEIQDSDMERQEESGYLHPYIIQYDGFVEMIDYSESPHTTTENFSHHAISKAIEDDSQSQYEGYVGMKDYTDCILNPTEILTGRAVSVQKESESGSLPHSPLEGYVDMTDYTDCYFGENSNKSICIAHF